MLLTCGQGLTTVTGRRLVRRSEALEQLRSNEHWDLIVVGGGATGLGAAVDGAARGYRTLLLEAADFAKGTSSRSTKLVHGGVRYLAQGNVVLVRDALRERGLLRRNAPHLVHAMPFVVPAYQWWARPWYGLGLTVYDVLAGRLSLGRSRVLSREETLRRAPTLEPEGLRGGILYYDGQFDDTRLAVALLRTALDKGATALNYMPVTGFLYENGKVSGVHAHDAETGEQFAIPALGVLNATGVFADGLRRADDPQARPMIVPSQGVHIVLDRSFLPGDTAVMIPRTDDGRVLFAVPWHDRVIVGTTDTKRPGAELEPRALPAEVDFLLSHAARYLTRDPSPEDVLSVFAGLRPLVQSGDSATTSSIARDHVVTISRSGLVTITGGKWTTYRHMAEDAVDQAAKVAGLRPAPSTTEELHLHSWQEAGDGEPPLAVYGSDAPALRALMAERPGLDAPLHPNLPYLAGEVVWAARHELARTIDDVLARRTRAILLDARASWEVAPRVAELIAQELGHDEGWQRAEVERFRELVAGYMLVEPALAAG